MPKKYRIRKIRSFTVDDGVFTSFRDRCKKKGKNMSREIEELMQ